jgi:hypothetical protein
MLLIERESTRIKKRKLIILKEHKKAPTTLLPRVAFSAGTAAADGGPADIGCVLAQMCVAIETHGTNQNECVHSMVTRNTNTRSRRSQLLQECLCIPTWRMPKLLPPLPEVDEPCYQERQQNQATHHTANYGTGCTFCLQCCEGMG